MSKSTRMLLIFAIAGALCLAYLWFFGAASMFALEATYVGWKMPAVKRVPIELPDQSIAQVPGRRLIYFGYEFEVPWEIDQEKSKQVGEMQLVAFRSGNTRLVSRTVPKEFVNSFLPTGNADTAGLRALIFTQRDSSSEPPITQAQINRVIQSLRKSTIKTRQHHTNWPVRIPRGCACSRPRTWG